MTDLKTLKDIIDFETYTEVKSSAKFITEKRLKAEAVKLYKKLDKIKEGIFKIGEESLYEIDDESSDITAVKLFLKWWFNLTEEDLK